MMRWKPLFFNYSFTDYDLPQHAEIKWIVQASLRNTNTNHDLFSRNYNISIYNIINSLEVYSGESGLPSALACDRYK